MNLQFYAIAGVVLVAAFVGHGFYQYNEGRHDERVEMLEKVAAKQQELDALKRRHADELTKLVADYTRERRRADAKIANLIAQNAELRSWAETPIPADAVAYAWGLPESGREPVPDR